MNRLHCESESFKMDLILDINSWLYPMDLGESFIIGKLIAFAYWSAGKLQHVRTHLQYCSNCDNALIVLSNIRHIERNVDERGNTEFLRGMFICNFVKKKSASTKKFGYYLQL